MDKKLINTFRVLCKTFPPLNYSVYYTDKSEGVNGLVYYELTNLNNIVLISGEIPTLDLIEQIRKL